MLVLSPQPRYKDDDHKKVQFPKDCMALASKQNIYAPQLKELGVIDEVIWEKDGEDRSIQELLCTGL